jgi:glycerophosphoryl diester phosphodiesterase
LDQQAYEEVARMAGSSTVDCGVRKVEFIAHRGSSFVAPENTLAAFRLGWKETTTCELDVHATVDGQIVVIHDETALRTTGFDLVVARHTLKELQRLDIGSWKGTEWRDERVSSLADVLRAMPRGKRLLIEIKGWPESVKELARVIRASGRADAVALQAFDAATCARAKETLPDLPVHLLAKLGSNRRDTAKVWKKALSTVKAMELDGLGVNDAPGLNAAVVEEVHAAKGRLNIWTVDSVAAARRLVAMGVDGIITNRPGWLKAQLKKPARLVKARRRS